MRQSAVCAKCNHRRFFVVRGVSHEGFEGQSHLLVAAYFKPGPMPAMFSKEPSQGSVERWICAGCGYMEDYAIDANAFLEAKAGDPKSGVRIVDGQPSPTGVFR